MIKSNILSKTACCVWLVAMICSVSFVQAKERSELPVRRPFSNFAVGVNAGTVGFGASVATPLWSHISLRGGFSVAPFSYSYTYDDFDFSDILSEIPDPSTSVADLNNVELGLKAELQMTSGASAVRYRPVPAGQLLVLHLGRSLFRYGKADYRER